MILATVALMLLVGCAPQESAPKSDSNNSSKQPAVEFVWSADADCAMCHAVENESMTDATCLASTHEKEGNTCATCHTDKTGLNKAHEGATPEGAEKAKKLRSTTIDENVCLSCHDGYEQLAEKTASSTALTDSDGTVVNPHALPEHEKHADTTCADCHVMHTDEPPAESAPGYCSSCHHAGIYECYTCHE